MKYLLVVVGGILSTANNQHSARLIKPAMHTILAIQIANFQVLLPSVLT